MEPLKTAVPPTHKALTLLDEFKTFAFKGNVIDLAVGVIIGAAFAKIVDALVKGVMMPLIGMVLPGEQDYKEWMWEFAGQKVLYGQLLAEIVNFLIIAAVLFLFIVKFMGWITRLKKAEAAALPKPTKEQELLTEIRDLLKARPGSGV